MSVYLTVCLYVCAIAKHPLPGVLKTYSWRHISYMGLQSHNYYIFNDILQFSTFSVFCFSEPALSVHQPTVDNGQVSRGGLCVWLLALVTCKRWQVTRETWHIKSDMWSVNGDFFLIICFIHLCTFWYRHRLTECLLYAGFLKSLITPIYKDPRLKWSRTWKFLLPKNVSEVVSGFVIFDQKYSKIARKKKLIFGFLLTILLYIAGE